MYEKYIRINNTIIPFEEGIAGEVVWVTPLIDKEAEKTAFKNFLIERFENTLEGIFNIKKEPYEVDLTTNNFFQKKVE